MNSFPNFDSPNYSYPPQRFTRQNNPYQSLLTPRQSTSNYNGMRPGAALGTGWNYSLPFEQEGLGGSRSSVTSGFGFITPPQVHRNRQGWPQHPETTGYPTKFQDGNQEEWCDNEEEKGGASKRFNRNHILMKDVLDGDIANCESTLVSTERVESLQRQSDLLQKEVDKEKDDAMKTVENCDSRIKDFHSTTAAFHKAMAEFSRPIPTGNFDESVEKYYNEIKQKLDRKVGYCNCDGGSNKEDSYWEDGIKIPHLDWKKVLPTQLRNVSMEALQHISQSQAVPPHLPRPVMNTGRYAPYNYPHQQPPPQTNSLRMLNHHHQQQYSGSNRNYHQRLPVPHHQYAAPHQLSERAETNRYFQQWMAEYATPMLAPPIRRNGTNQFSSVSPPQLGQRSSSNRLLSGGGIVEVDLSPSPPVENGIDSSDDVEGGITTPSVNNWVNGHEPEGQGGDAPAAGLRSTAPTLARLLEAPNLEETENENRQFSNSNVLFSALTGGGRHAGGSWDLEAAGNATSTVDLVDDENEIQEENGIENGFIDEFGECELFEVQNGGEDNMLINLHREFQGRVEEITLSDEDSE